MRKTHRTNRKRIGLNFGILIGALIVAGFSAEATSQTAGFLGGNQFEYTSATGDVSVSCFHSGGPPPIGPSSARYRCHGYAFTPTAYPLFTGPSVNADQVELVAFRQDGSSFSKKSAYDPSIGRSTETFNLWVETVFQKPLLKLGRNDVRWTLTQRGQVIATGNFIADVFQRPSLQCPSVSQTSWDMNDCRTSNRVCQEYFSRFGSQCR